MSRLTVRDRLAAPPLRGPGAAPAVAAAALRQPDVLRQLVEATSDSRTVVSTRAANALRKVQEAKPELLLPFAGKLARCALACEEQRTRWDLTLVIGALPLHGRERKLATDVLIQALDSQSAFLRAFALQALVRSSSEDTAIAPCLRRALENAREDASAAVRARARKLLASVDNPPAGTSSGSSKPA